VNEYEIRKRIILLTQKNKSNTKRSNFVKKGD